MIPKTIWLTGLSGAGKTTLARALEQGLRDLRQPVCVLDGDELRKELCSDLGFSPEDRHENARRVAQVARLINQAGRHAICALMSPRVADRALARRIVGPDAFHEVHVNTPLSVCEARDAKGLYRRAREGLIADLTGVDSAYEVPETPALVLDTSVLAPEECLKRLLAVL
jgi:adenylylsulfate kinase